VGVKEVKLTLSPQDWPPPARFARHLPLSGGGKTAIPARRERDWCPRQTL